MADSVTIRGVVGELRWGYHHAATVRDWTAVRTSPTDPGSLTATIVDVDAYRVSQRPIVFVPHKDKPWAWPIASLQIADGVLNAQLVPPQETARDGDRRL